MFIRVHRLTCFLRRDFGSPRYLFHHMRCGILVVIRNKRLVVFAPFANKDYTNDWDGA